LFLQQVGGYSATAAGLAQLPVTLVLLALSTRFGALAGRYGPRLFMTLGPIVGGAGYLLLLTTTDDAVYVTQVLPGLVLFGVGLAMTVAPLTSAILGSIPAADAGIGSAVNNAVSRVAGLVVIAFAGVIVGGVLDLDGFHRSLVVTAALLVLGGVLSWVGSRDEHGRATRAEGSCPVVLPDRQEVARRGVEAARAVGRVGRERDDDVLDPHAEAAGEVDARLDGEAHAGLDRAVLALDHVRRLVGRGPDPVPGAVHEVLAVPGLDDHGARGPVDVLARRTGAHGVDPGLLRAAHDVVDLALLRRAGVVRAARDEHGARGVRPVPVPQPAEVEHHEVAGLDHAISRVVVRVGAVRAGAHEREVDLLVPVR